MSTEIAAFDELKAKVALFVAPVKGISVKDAASNAVATGTLKTIKELMRQVESCRVDFVKPLNDRVKEVNRYASEISEPLEAAEREVKSAMGAFAKEEAFRLAEERRRIEDERLKELRDLEEKERRMHAEAEARRKAEQKRLEDKQSEERRRCEEAQRKEAQRMEAFGVDPGQGRRDAEAAAEARRVKESDDRAILAKRMAEEEATAKARLEREAKDREREAREKTRQLEASRPKNTRQIMKWEVIDEELVPGKFWDINAVKVRAAIIGGERDIPGIRVWTETEVVTR